MEFSLLKYLMVLQIRVKSVCGFLTLRDEDQNLKTAIKVLEFESLNLSSMINCMYAFINSSASNSNASPEKQHLDKKLHAFFPL